MAEQKQVTAVFDYGASQSSVQIYERGTEITGKPIFIYQMKTVDYVNDLGINCEAVDHAFHVLMTEASNFLLANREYNLAGIGNTSHAASPVYLNEDDLHAFRGSPKYGMDEHGSIGPKDGFRQRCPSAEYLTTATPDWGLFLNWTRGADSLTEEFHELGTRIETLLFLNSYMGFKLTGERAVDFTQIAAHGYGADFTGGVIAVSSVIDELGLKDYMPPIIKAGDILGEVTPEIAAKYKGIPVGIPVVEGAHDSLAIYKLMTAKAGNDVVGVSSGTWAVIMADRAFQLTADLESADVFYNGGCDNQPVRSVIFKGGQGRSALLELYEKRFNPDGTNDPILKGMAFDPTVLDRVIREGHVLLPAFMDGVGPYGGLQELSPESLPDALQDQSLFHHTLGMWYGVQLARAVEIASTLDITPEKSMMPFYNSQPDLEGVVLGGVAQDLLDGEENITVECLSRVTQRPVYAFGLKGSAAAFGTNLLVNLALEPDTPEAEIAARFNVLDRQVSEASTVAPEVREYVEGWEEAVRRSQE